MVWILIVSDYGLEGVLKVDMELTTLVLVYTISNPFRRKQCPTKRNQKTQHGKWHLQDQVTSFQQQEN